MKKLLIASLVLFLAACSNNPENKQEQLAQLKKEQAELSSKISKLESEIGAKEEFITKDVSIYEVKASTFKNYVEIQGKVDAEENVQVNAEAAGVITRVYVSIGQSVSKGQVLAQIDDAVLRQNVAQIQTQLDLATNLFKRQKNLWDQKIGTEVQYLNAKSQKEGLEKQMAVVKQQADMYKIKSPISGTIDQMDYKVGQAVQPGIPGIRVINASNLKAKAMVSETYAGRIDKGDEVLVLFPNTNDSLKTKLSFASKTIDPASRSFNIEVNLPSKKSFQPNMLAILKIVDYKKENALTVPIKAIQKSEKGDYVYISEGGKAKRAVIKVGNVYDGNAEILSGIKAGDQVVTMGFGGLNEGDSLKKI
ncbi:efflux transporter periplasmic adaptor subunit [Pedobacter psychrophilus]|uniref:Efflux transporter periplasmic adaptor subunit n=1 Tax=Pedobacter psychrophilus TaxID=1826909 RepID=A0A179DIH4_9SPHI|nr:efflux RND transporter periplasmic adaptor subunit [Pedobacter psychrophilus]OAQ40748.1 efflux transporter periplasmic adaptor subunit [Pedobacter psychrophilus]